MTSDGMVRLDDVADLDVGYAFKSADFTADSSGSRLLRGDNIGQGVTRWERTAYWPQAELAQSRYELREADVVLAMDRPWIEAGLKYATISAPDLPALLVQRVARLRAKPGTDQGYLGCVIGSRGFTEFVLAVQTGTSIPHISGKQIAGYRLRLHSLSEQRAIAEVLGALDDKISANVKTVDLLVQHQIAEYEISLRRGFESQPLDKVADFHNRKRVPLSAKERDERPGSIPYYGATGVFGSVDQSLFNDNLVLVGEDGSVITPGGLPVIQYIWGPSWVNNHAHVLTGRSVSTELLRFALSRTNVASLVTGAVQPKISMGKLKGLVLELPTSNELLRLEQLVASEMALLRGTSDETKTLIAMREALLPQLMSGKIRVKDAEQMVGDVA